MVATIVHMLRNMLDPLCKINVHAQGSFRINSTVESKQYSSVPDGTKYLAETQALGLGQILSCS